jgi:hypothetical protein
VPSRLSLLPLVLALLPAFGAAAAEPAVDVHWNLRLRHEHVDDAAFGRDAAATTLRLRAGLGAQLGGGWRALVEGEAIAAAGAYDSGANGRSGYPAIADAAGAELNQAWIGWKGDRAAFTAGRQRIVFDNQRWVGNSGWRQNEQTFDALAADWQPTGALALRYAWLDRVHRVAGDDARDPRARERALSTHLLNATWKRGSPADVDVALTGYGYLHDDRDVASASTATWGVRATVGRVRGGRGPALVLEAARQADHAGNPLDFAHGYRLVEPSWSWPALTLRGGWERLGGDGTHALQAPLGTLHAFNGWADRFLATPPDGLEDRYFGAQGKAAGKLEWALVAHDYRAAHGDAPYGREWDASLAWAFTPAVKGMVKLADYDARGFARDATKVWAQLEWTH